MSAFVSRAVYLWKKNSALQNFPHSRFGWFTLIVTYPSIIYSSYKQLVVPRGVIKSRLPSISKFFFPARLHQRETEHISIAQHQRMYDVCLLFSNAELEPCIPVMSAWSKQYKFFSITFLTSVFRSCWPSPLLGLTYKIMIFLYLSFYLNLLTVLLIWKVIFHLLTNYLEL